MTIDDNAFFREAAIRICGSLDIESALRRCMDYISDFIPVDAMDMRFLDQSLKMLPAVANVSRAGSEKAPNILPWHDENEINGLPRWEHMEDIKVINRPAQEPGMKELSLRMGWSLDVSLMIMRLELEGRRIGVLGLRVNGTDRFTDEHARLLLLLHEPFAVAMSNALKHQEVIRLKDLLADDNRFLQKQLRELSGDEIIGADFGLREVMTMVRQVAHLDSPVLLLGETGVGKEVIANALHYSSSRSSGPFIEINCGAIPESLIDSELFGHERGAFTGAISQKRGRFERADKGTIFLDEIGELPPQAQVRLLRVIQTREIERVGGTQTIPVDIRIISATNRNLEEMVQGGLFREDLWYRLNVFPITIPPLRMRKQDIPALVHHFIERKSAALKIRAKPALSAGTLDRLMAYDWPGNVRELENLVERALIQHRGGVLDFDQFLAPPSVGANTENARLDKNGRPITLDEHMARHIMRALETADGKINGPGGAAELLDLHPNTLRKKMMKLGISFGRKKKS